jgi:hypothetical protein
MEKIEKLKELKSLLDSGIITREEFEQLKNEILNENGLKQTFNINEDIITHNNNVKYTKSPISEYFIFESPKDEFTQNQTFWLKENILLESSRPNNYLMLEFNPSFKANLELSLGITINRLEFNLIFNLAINIYNNNKSIEDNVQLVAPLLTNAKIYFIVDDQTDVLTLDNCSSYKLSPYSSCSEQTQITTDSANIIEQLAKGKSIKYKVTYSTNDYENQTTSKGLFNNNDVLKFQAFYNSFFDANFGNSEILSQIKHI